MIVYVSIGCPRAHCVYILRSSRTGKRTSVDLCLLYPGFQAVGVAVIAGVFVAAEAMSLRSKMSSKRYDRD